MMQNHIFSNVDGTYDAQNGPKWPSKHPKIAQNSPKPKKTQKTQKITNQLAISFKKSPILGVVRSFLEILVLKIPTFEPKIPKSAFFR